MGGRMARKFDAKTFMNGFLNNLRERYRSRRGASVISLSTVARETCRELKYAQWKNRDTMTRLIKAWWESLPERDDDRYGKRLFCRNCHLSQSWGPTFISIRDVGAFGCKCWDLISFW